jgi:hypothetical protein
MNQRQMEKAVWAWLWGYLDASTSEELVQWALREDELTDTQWDRFGKAVEAVRDRISKMAAPPNRRTP